MNIKAIREKYSYTQEDLARLLDVSVSTVRKWEQTETEPGRRSRKDIQNMWPNEEDVKLLFGE